MNNNLLYIIQTTTAEQLKTVLDKNKFVDKNLKDFNKGKELIDSLIELNKTNVDKTVIDSLLIYYIYKLKGGK